MRPGDRSALVKISSESNVDSCIQWSFVTFPGF